MTLKCGCNYDESARSFIKYCREHAKMVLNNRASKFRALLAKREADALDERTGRTK